MNAFLLNLLAYVDTEFYYTRFAVAVGGQPVFNPELSYVATQLSFSASISTELSSPHFPPPQLVLLTPTLFSSS